MLPHTGCKTKALKSSLFPRTIPDWNILDLYIWNSCYTAFKKQKFIHEFRPVSNSVVNIHNTIAIKLLTIFRVGLSHINVHKYHKL